MDQPAKTELNALSETAFQFVAAKTRLHRPPSNRNGRFRPIAAARLPITIAQSLSPVQLMSAQIFGGVQPESEEMMLILIGAAAMQVSIGAPKAPEIPPPFSKNVEAQARSLGMSVIKEHKKCDIPLTKATTAYVEAMGSPANSPEWEKAKFANYEAIQACRGYRSALRAQMDFMQDLVANGSRHDADIAMLALGTYTFEVKGEEDYFLRATLDYDELVMFGRGRNKDGSDPNGRK